MGIYWDDVCACTNEGIPAILGNRSEYRAQVKAVIPDPSISSGI